VGFANVTVAMRRGAKYYLVKCPRNSVTSVSQELRLYQKASTHLSPLNCIANITIYVNTLFHVNRIYHGISSTDRGDAAERARD
jgi:hypothetical protein